MKELESKESKGIVFRFPVPNFTIRQKESQFTIPDFEESTHLLDLALITDILSVASNNAAVGTFVCWSHFDDSYSGQFFGGLELRVIS